MPSAWAHRLLALLGPARRLAPYLTAALGVLVVVTGPIAFQHEAQLQNTSMGLSEGLYWTVSLFVISPSRLQYPQQIYLQLLHFLAPGLTASALIGAVVNILEERGTIFLTNFRGHVVIGGLGNLGSTLARHLIRHRKQLVAIERSGDAPAIEEMRAAGASLVLIADMTAVDPLRRARAHLAEKVFFVSKSDLANLDAAFQLRRVCADEAASGSVTGRPPLIFAHCFDSGLADALGRQLRERAGQGAHIITFNSYRFAAKALIGHLLRDRLLSGIRLQPGFCLLRTRWPEGGDTHPPEAAGRPRALEEDRRRLMAAFRVAPDAEAPGGERFTIVGIGRFGRSVLRELLDVSPAGSRFFVIERSESEMRTALDLLDPAERERCEVGIGDAVGGGMVERIVAFGPSAALVCTDSDLSNLRLAAQLQRRGLRTVTRMSGNDAAELSRGLEEEGIGVVNMSRLFRVAIPILTHEQQLRACLDLDVNRTPDEDHLFYLAQIHADERRRIGSAALSLSELPGGDALPTGDGDLSLVWYREVERLAQ